MMKTFFIALALFLFFAGGEAWWPAGLDNKWHPGDYKEPRAGFATKWLKMHKGHARTAGNRAMEWKNGGMEEWKNGGMESMEKRKNGGMMLHAFGSMLQAPSMFVKSKQ